MNFKVIASATTTLVLLGFVVLSSAKAQVGAAPPPPNKHHGEVWEWYQGEKGHWRQDKHNGEWHWFGAKEHGEHHEHEETAQENGSWEWYQGHKGHWQKEHGGWSFHTPELVCNNAGKNCRSGGVIPPNGEGMVSAKNPKWFWHCDEDGHHCDWAKRPGM